MGKINGSSLNYLCGLWKENERDMNVNNKIILVSENGISQEVDKLENCIITFRGGGNVITVHEPYSFNNTTIICGNNSYIEFGK